MSGKHVNIFQYIQPTAVDWDRIIWYRESSEKLRWGQLNQAHVAKTKQIKEVTKTNNRQCPLSLRPESKIREGVQMEPDGTDEF